MAAVMLVRADDHLVVGVHWSGFTVSGAGPSARLVAGAQATLTLTLPPQHVAEETSPPGSPAPLQQPLSTGGSVPVWRGALSGPTRIKVKVTAGTQIPLTAEGILAAAADNPLIAAANAPGADDTAIELPFRMLIAPAPRGGQPGATVVCRHPAHAGTDSAGLWRTRLVDSTAPAADTLLDAHLEMTVASQGFADSPDPDFGAIDTIPLTRSARVRVHLETTLNNRPARLNRLELSALGGTLDAAGLYPNFEWEHRTVLGRDMHVRTLFMGALYPLGHRAVYAELTDRNYDTGTNGGGAAVLRTSRVLTILEPVRHPPADSPVRRGFPMGDVTITSTVFTNLLSPDNAHDPAHGWQKFSFPGAPDVPTYFMPSVTGSDGNATPVLFPVSCSTSAGEVKLNIPLVFVADLRPKADSLANPDVADKLAAFYGQTKVDIPPTDIDLVGAPPTEAPEEVEHADVHEVHSLTVAGYDRSLSLADGYRARLSQLEIALPAMRSLQNADPRKQVTFAKNYLANGPTEDILFDMVDKLPIDFSKQADRSGGLLAPSYVTNAISRQFGPIDARSLKNPVTGNIDPGSLFPTDGATLLGFPLRSLLAGLKAPPQITAIPLPDPGSAPKIQMRWNNVKLSSNGAFRAKLTSTLDLTITTDPTSSQTDCTVTDFTLQLPPGPKAVLELSFAKMAFSQQGGKAPSLKVDGVDARFINDLALVENLKKAVDLGDAGKFIDVTPSGIVVHYSVPAPPITSGVFVMRNITFTARIVVPFDGEPVSISLSFAARANPFELAVMMFGGTGYMELELDRRGIQRFEAALEFGAFVAVDFVVASGEVHALGGVRFVLEGGEVTITGYLRIGGSVDVLGLISVSIELCLALAYRSSDKALVGRATLVIEIDLTLWSDSVELDSGEWKFAGGGGGEEAPQLTAAAAAAASGLDLWSLYRSAFTDTDVIEESPALAAAGEQIDAAAGEP